MYIIFVLIKGVLKTSLTWSGRLVQQLTEQDHMCTDQSHDAILHNSLFMFTKRLKLHKIQQCLEIG